MAFVLSSGGSLASIAHAAAKHHLHRGHHCHHRHGSQAASGPLIRIHEVNEDGTLVTKTVTPGHGVGVVTCGTILPSTPGIVYLGHEGGYVTVWGCGDQPVISLPDSSIGPTWQRPFSQSSLTSPTSSSSDEGESQTKEESPLNTTNGSNNGPVCLRKVKISISDVISLEGVGSKLWAGTRKGLIYAYDVTGNVKCSTWTV